MSTLRERLRGIRPEIAALLGVTTLGALLRLWHLAAHSLWFDECASLYLGRFVLHPSQLFNHEWNTEAPLNAVLTWLWHGLVRALTDFPPTAVQSDFLLRLLPCLLSIATIPLLYALAKKLTGDAWIGVLAGFFFAISPYYVLYGQELRIYAFLVPAALLTALVMLNALDTGRWPWWLALTLGLAVLVYAHFIAVWLVFSFSVYYILAWLADRRYIARWTVINLAALALMAPALFLAFEMNRMVHQVEHQWYGTPTFKTMFITFKDFFAGYGPTVWAYWPLFGLALALHVLGLVRLACTRWRAALFIAVMTWVPLVGNVILWSSRDFSFYEHRLFVASGAIAMIGVAAGLCALPARPARAAMLAIWLFCTAPLLRDYYQQRLHPIHEHRWAIYQKTDIRGAAQYIAANWQEGDLLVYPNHMFAYPMRHYLPDTPQVRIGYDASDIRKHIQAMSHPELSEHHGLLPAVKEEATANARRLWYVESQGITMEWKPFTEPIRKWLDTVWRAREHHELNGLELVLYTR